MIGCGALAAMRWVASDAPVIMSTHRSEISLGPPAEGEHRAEVVADWLTNDGPGCC